MRLLIIILSLNFLACRAPLKEDTKKGTKANVQDSPEREIDLIIDIQPFSDVPKEYVDHVYNELSLVHAVIHVNKAIPLPHSAYYPKRNRYRADSLINKMRKRTPKGHVTIGITTRDISHTKGNIEDYGIMGLGYQPGNACVVSTFRLSRKNLLSQLYKVSIHELGHTQGLPHCPDKFCYMRDAQGKNHTDEEKDFCEKCKKHLLTKGWTFITQM